MDRNVANTDGSTHEKLAHHADRSREAERYFGPTVPELELIDAALAAMSV